MLGDAHRGRCLALSHQRAGQVAGRDHRDHVIGVRAQVFHAALERGPGALHVALGVENGAAMERDHGRAQPARVHGEHGQHENEILGATAGQRSAGARRRLHTFLEALL